VVFDVFFFVVDTAGAGLASTSSISGSFVTTVGSTGLASSLGGSATGAISSSDSSSLVNDCTGSGGTGDAGVYSSTAANSEGLNSSIVAGWDSSTTATSTGAS